MIAYFVLGLALFLGCIVLSRWFVSANPKAVIGALRWVMALLGVGLIFIMLWGGAKFLAALALPLLIPLLLRAGPLLSRLKAAAGPAPGQTSTVETRFLRMTLDHDSGAMSGVVREGPFRGRALDELDETELVELWRDCRAEDEQSAAVLEAYLDRLHGQDWRSATGFDRAEGKAGNGNASGETQAPSGGTMTLEEAYAVLGLARGASEEDIRSAHRRLMSQYHPDRGGSNYLAAKINQAKDLLINRKG